VPTPHSEIAPAGGGSKDPPARIGARVLCHIPAAPTTPSLDPEVRRPTCIRRDADRGPTSRFQFGEGDRRERRVQKSGVEPMSGSRKRVLAVALLILSGSSSPLAASPTAWNGGAGSWSDSTLWSPNLVPGAGDDVFIDGGKSGTPSDVMVNAAAAGDNLTVNAGDRIAIANSNSLTIGAAGVGGTLTNDCDITLESMSSVTSLILEEAVTLAGSGTLTFAGSSTIHRILGAGTAPERINPNGHTLTIQGGSEAQGP
jgi:hypothetical protein